MTENDGLRVNSTSMHLPFRVKSASFYFYDAKHYLEIIYNPFVTSTCIFQKLKHRSLERSFQTGDILIFSPQLLKVHNGEIKHGRMQNIPSGGVFLSSRGT